MGVGCKMWVGIDESRCNGEFIFIIANSQKYWQYSLLSGI